MTPNYQKILDFMITSGKRLVTKSGKIQDIGIAKMHLTEEDIAIERGFKEIISVFGSNHVLYAEEENTTFPDSESVWVADPISSTATFIAGLPHYAIVISHLVKGKAVFAAVYDPSVDEMFTAYAGKGSFLNSEKIKIDESKKSILFFPSREWRKPEVTDVIKNSLSDYKIEDVRYSVGIICCEVARGNSGGLILLAKDSFPQFAGGLILREAGGFFTNIKGDSDIKSDDRIFVGGNRDVYGAMFPAVKDCVTNQTDNK